MAQSVELEHVLGGSLHEHDIAPIDMVVVNLYPFEAASVRPGITREELIEEIDIGGPTLVRAAAKNPRFVNIVVNASDYGAILEEMAANDGATSLDTRFNLAIKAYEHTAAYDGAIANYFGRLFRQRLKSWLAARRSARHAIRRCVSCDEAA